jgi:hypothetical protein
VAHCSLRFEGLFVEACNETSAQVHLAKRGATIAIERWFLLCQYGQTMRLPAIVGRPIRPAKRLLKSLCDGVGALALELRWALGIGKGLIAQGSEVEVVWGIRGMVDLALERVEPVC